MHKYEHDAFKKWGEFLREKKISNTPTLNRFAARYKLSRKYKGIDANIGEKTLRGYSKLFHVFLAHSAFDSLNHGVEELANRKDSPMFVDIEFDLHNYPMIDDALAEDIRRIKNIDVILLEYADNDKRVARLKAFFGHVCTEAELAMPKLVKAMNEISEPNNLLVVASAMRNVVAHGNLSATGASAITKKNCETIVNLPLLDVPLSCSIMRPSIAVPRASFSQTASG
jgi:hypothetical protein